MSVKRNRFFLTLLPVLALLFTVGCADMDRVDTKMDMVDTHLGKPGALAYEGQLVTSRRVGSMTALQFKNGDYFDVSDASPAFYEGDTVRIYQTEDGYEARLWRTAASASGKTGQNNRS